MFIPVGQTWDGRWQVSCHSGGGRFCGGTWVENSQKSKFNTLYRKSFKLGEIFYLLVYVSM